MPGYFIIDKVITKPEMEKALGDDNLFFHEGFLSRNAKDLLLRSTGFDKRDEWLIRLGYILAVNRKED
jgi:hypothetical protein